MESDHTHHFAPAPDGYFSHWEGGKRIREERSVLTCQCGATPEGEDR